MFTVTDHERKTGAFEPEKLAHILHQISTEGYAVVGRLVSEESCNLLGQAILEDIEQVRSLARPTRHEINTAAGHLQLGLRRSGDYIRADLVANPLIEHLVTGVLGKGAWLGFYNGNVNLPGSGFQKVHYDRPYSWLTEEEAKADGQTWPPPTTTLSCSIALTDITEDNGATEIYPKSHHETEVTKWPLGERVSSHPELLERWQPPARMPIPAGAICFRDPRMWHRGVPNNGEAPRPMIALTYHAGQCLHWRGRLVRDASEADITQCQENPALKILDDGSLGDARLVFDASAQDTFQASENLHGINRNVRFLDPPARVNHFVDAHEIGGARISLSGEIGPNV